jgi:hypothetical protein
MQCDYTSLNHNLLVSKKKKVVNKGMNIKGVYNILSCVLRAILSLTLQNFMNSSKRKDE